MPYYSNAWELQGNSHHLGIIPRLPSSRQVVFCGFTLQQIARLCAFIGFAEGIWGFPTNRCTLSILGSVYEGTEILGNYHLLHVGGACLQPPPHPCIYATQLRKWDSSVSVSPFAAEDHACRSEVEGAKKTLRLALDICPSHVAKQI